jgi:hypothetical protein
MERHEKALRAECGDALVDKAFRHQLAARLLMNRASTVEDEKKIKKELSRIPTEVAAYLYQLIQAEELLLAHGYVEDGKGGWTEAKQT